MQRRRAVGILGTLLLVLVLVGALASRRADLAAAWRATGDVSTGWLVLVGAAVALHVLARSWAFATTVPDLRLRRALVATEASLAPSNALVGGGAIGSGLKIAMLRSWAVPAEAIGVAFVASGVAAATALWTVALLGATLGYAADGGRVDLVVAAGSIAVLVGAGAFWWAVLRHDRPARALAVVGDRVLARLRRRFPAAPCPDLAGGVLRLQATARQLVRTSGPRLLVAALASHLSLALVLLVALHAYGVGRTPVQVLAAFGVVRVIASFSPLPGGVGVIEVGLVGLLSAGTATDPGVLGAVLAFRAGTNLLPLVTGPLCALAWRAGRGRRSGAAVSAAPLSSGEAQPRPVPLDEPLPQQALRHA